MTIDPSDSWTQEQRDIFGIDDSKRIPQTIARWLDLDSGDPAGDAASSYFLTTAQELIEHLGLHGYQIVRRPDGWHRGE